MTETISYAIGQSFELQGKACRITNILDVDRVLVEYTDGGGVDTVPIHQLTPPNGAPKQWRPAVDAISKKDMKEARHRYEIIKDLVELRHDRTAAVHVAAKASGVTARTIWNWINIYTERYQLSDLAPRRSRKRASRIGKKQEKIIQEVIETFWLKKQKPTQAAAIKKIHDLCKAAKLDPPAPNTIRARIRAVDKRLAMEKREGKRAAKYKYGEIKGHFPDADFPLAVVQIDHTELDVELVDDEHRLPLGRPWLTLAIDVYSRMVTGMYLSLDHPSAFSVGMCIQHSVLTKEAELDALGIEDSWPVWGKMRTLHFDNGKDFRSKTIETACKEQNIGIQFRPVKTPHFGAHIERLLGTISKKVHELPGTTFSNILKKGEYNSAKNAVLTLDEARRILTRFIVGEYHERFHKGIQMSPKEKWRKGTLGDGKTKGTGLPDKIGDPESFRIDFLELTERTVTRDGIVWDHIHYFAPFMRPFIDSKKGGRAVKFKLRRDPRDISQIYFLDPELKEYLAVPYRHQGRPSISKWELRAATERIRKEGKEKINEEAIFKARQAIDREIEEATKKTRSARRTKQRRKDHVKSRKQMPANDASPIKDTAIGEDEEFSLDELDFTPRWRDIE